MQRAGSQSDQRIFDTGIRMSHWLTALLMLVVFTLAFSIDYATSKSAHTILLQLHRSFGLTIWVISLGRFIWRQFTTFPNWPAGMPRLMQVAAQASEYAFYVLLITQPILGLLHTNARGEQVDFFLLGNLPPLISQDRPLARRLLAVHETVGLLLLGLIVVHAGAALYHHFWRRDDTLRAMLPQKRQKAAPELAAAADQGV